MAKAWTAQVGLKGGKITRGKRWPAWGQGVEGQHGVCSVPQLSFTDHTSALRDKIAGAASRRQERAAEGQGETRTLGHCPRSPSREGGWDGGAETSGGAECPEPGS